MPTWCMVKVDRCPTFAQFRYNCCRAYLADQIMRYPTITDAARHSGMNRTDFYKVCERHDIDIPKIQIVLKRASHE